MRFEVDENLPLQIVSDLQAAGYEADSVNGEGLSGASDVLLLERVQKERRVFLTVDKGIANIRNYPGDSMQDS